MYYTLIQSTHQKQNLNSIVVILVTPFVNLSQLLNLKLHLYFNQSVHCMLSCLYNHGYLVKSFKAKSRNVITWLIGVWFHQIWNLGLSYMTMFLLLHLLLRSTCMWYYGWSTAKCNLTIYATIGVTQRLWEDDFEKKLSLYFPHSSDSHVDQSIAWRVGKWWWMELWSDTIRGD